MTTSARPIIATLHRGKLQVWTRYYSRITTAVPRAVQLAIEEGFPGDVVEVACTVLGVQIATVKMKANSDTDVVFTDELNELKKRLDRGHKTAAQL